MNSNSRYPLAHDLDGEPIQLPPEAIAWRVRRRSGKQGRPQCVYHHETGAQLAIALDATIDALAPYGPGVYRLDAVDKDGKVIPSVVAYTEVRRPATEPDDDATDDSPTERQQLHLIRELVESNVRVMEAMASAFGKVRPTENALAPVMISPAPPPPAADEKTTADQIVDVVQKLIPMLPHLKMAWDMMSGGTNPFASSATPADQAPVEGGQAL